MANLGDIVGQIMAELSWARVEADVEAVRLAETYSDHDQLRHVPAPRICLREVEVDLPVVISGGLPVATVKRLFASAAEIAGSFHPEAVRELRRSGVELSARREATLKSRLVARSEPFEQPPGLPVDSGGLASELAEVALAILNKGERERLSDEALDTLVRNLRSTFRKSAARLQAPAGRLDVGVTPEEIRDAGDAAVTRIRFRLAEDRLE